MSATKKGNRVMENIKLCKIATTTITAAVATIENNHQPTQTLSVDVHVCARLRSRIHTPFLGITVKKKYTKFSGPLLSYQRTRLVHVFKNFSFIVIHFGIVHRNVRALAQTAYAIFNFYSHSFYFVLFFFFLFFY